MILKILDEAWIFIATVIVACEEEDDKGVSELTWRKTGHNLPCSSSMDRKELKNGEGS